MKAQRLWLLALPVLFAACASNKAVVKGPAASTVTSVGKAGAQSANASPGLAFVQRVSDQKVYTQNIVGNMTFTATMDGRKVSVPGAVRMRRDKVVRIQLFIPLLGSEVGRLEFTPDYVLVVDRMHKQYVKADYSQLDFLRENGLNFYSLQALFWNQLLLPGTTKVGEADLQKFSTVADGTGKNVRLSLTNGDMAYVWKADKATAHIQEADVTYSSTKHGKSSLTWRYSNFLPLGAKQFPATQEFSFTTSATDKVGKTTVRLEMENLNTSSDWEAETTVSGKYKQVDAEEVLGKLLNQ